MNALPISSEETISCESLTAVEWAHILRRCDRVIRDRAVARGAVIKAGSRQPRRFISFHELPLDFQSEAMEARRKEGVLTFRDLLDIIACDTRNAKVTRPFASYPPRAQLRAEKRMAVMQVYFDAFNAGRPEGVCNKLAQQKWIEVFGPDSLEVSDRFVGYKKIQRLRDRIRKAGWERAPKEAYLDEKSCPHPNATREPSPEFLKDFKARMTDSRLGVPSVNGVYSDYVAAWNSGSEIPGIGTRVTDDEPFPFTLHQLQRHAPARAVRELAGRGKFLAKVGGYLAAPPLDWSNVEPGRIVMFDDKVLNFHVLTDEGLRQFRPVIYLAYCAGTGRILNFIVREEGRMTQLDVEGLQAAVARDHGFHGGPNSKGPTLWIFEKGTVSISPARCEFLERRFRGYLIARTTGMLGGKTAPGDWSQRNKGNFFGKGRLEAMMGALDWFLHTVPGQTGNSFTVEPAVLGDTTLSLQKLINSARSSKNRPARSLIEESLLTGAMTRLIEWMESGDNVTAYEAARRQGLTPSLLHYSDFVTLLGEMFRRFNNRRGHRMQGFQTVWVDHPRNVPDRTCPGEAQRSRMQVTESPNDKAARMLTAMELQGRRLNRPDDADIFMLLHKIRRVTVKANGAVVDGIRYEHPESRAQRDAVSVFGAAKTFLALYNPVQPDAIYLLANPPGHVNASATETPKGFVPQLYEILPRAIDPDPTDAAAMKTRRENAAAFNAGLGRAAALAMEPMLMAIDKERAELRDRLEPVRAVVMGCQPPITPHIMPPSQLSQDIAEAEHAVNGGEPSTRASQSEGAMSDYFKILSED